MPSTTEEEVLNRIERYREGLLKVLSISSVVFCLVNVVTLWDVQRGGALWALGGVPPSLLAYVLVVRGRRRLSTYVLFYGVCGVIAGSMVYAAYPPLRGVGLQLMVLIATLFTFLEGHGPGAIYSACCIAGVFGGAMVDPELSGGYRFIVPSLEGATILLGWASAGFVARYGVDSERELKRRIQAMARIVVDAERIAQGDLTDDEMADRPPMVATMLEGLRGLVGRARESVSGLGAAMDQLQKTADETTAGASQQTAVVAETHRAIAELAQAAEVIEHASRDVLHNAQSTLDTNRLVEARIGVLAKHTERVAELLDLIRDVARRSEIIALNAALEGSRAGEAGRAFSLVAAEIQSLASSTTNTVGDVKEMVGSIHAATAASVASIEQATALAEDTTRAAREIGRATSAQRASAAEVVEAMAEVAMVTETIASASAETRVAVAEMRHLSEKLDASVGRFAV